MRSFNQGLLASVLLLLALGASSQAEESTRDPFAQKAKAQPAVESAPQPEPLTPEKRFFCIPSDDVSPDLALLPRLSVTGIVSVGGERWAIVKSSSGVQIVAEGFRLSSYRVTKISPEAVVVEHSGAKFRLPLKSDFG